MAFSIARQLFHAAILCVAETHIGFTPATFIHAMPHPDGGVLIASSNGHVMFIGHDPHGKIDTYHQAICLSDRKNTIKLAKNTVFTSVLCGSNLTGFFATSTTELELKTDSEIIETCASFIKIDCGSVDPLPVYKALNSVLENSSQQCVVIATRYLKLICKVSKAVGCLSGVGVTITTGNNGKDGKDGKDGSAPSIVKFNIEGNNFKAAMIVMQIKCGELTNAQGLEFIADVSGYDRSYQEAVNADHLAHWRRWHPIITAPKGINVEVKMGDGTIYPECHFAHDMSGEDQPPYSGWFVYKDGCGFRQIDEPKFWREIVEIKK